MLGAKNVNSDDGARGAARAAKADARQALLGADGGLLGAARRGAAADRGESGGPQEQENLSSASLLATWPNAGGFPRTAAAVAGTAGGPGGASRPRNPRAIRPQSPDTTRTVTFHNGVRKDSLRDGTVIVYFTNGDVKRSLPPTASRGGCVQYYYAEVATWHSSLADGREVYHFPSGQCEAHLPDGSKEILFADRSFRVVGRAADREDEVEIPRGWEAEYAVPAPPKNPII